jgi:hypothetical protein
LSEYYPKSIGNIQEDGNPRAALVAMFMDRKCVKNEMYRLEFSDLLIRINLLVYEEGFPRFSRVELSRALAIAGYEIKYYRGAHLSGYEWVEKAQPGVKDKKPIPVRIDPTESLSQFVGTQIYRIEYAMCSSDRMYECFQEWCSQRKEPLCTKIMFTRKIHEMLQPVVTRLYGGMLVFDDICLKADHDDWLSMKERLANRNKRAISIETYTLRKCRSSRKKKQGETVL